MIEHPRLNFGANIESEALFEHELQQRDAFSRVCESRSRLKPDIKLLIVADPA
jgi:hypothetical protein